jgi:hypothetical protein
MPRLFSHWFAKLRPVAKAVAWGVLLVCAAGWLLRPGNDPSFSQPLHATATLAGPSFVMATGPIDEAIEGVFFLDRLTGMLQCWVTSKNTGAFNGKFWYANVLEDVDAKGEKNPQLLMMVGNYQPVGANGKLANCLVYVLNDTNGKFAVYNVPWNPMLHSKRAVPYVEPMRLLNIGIAREPIR